MHENQTDKSLDISRLCRRDITAFRERERDDT
jgi:hypothetical protein